MATGFKTATVNASDVPSTQTDYPAYVDLSRLGITTLAEAQSVRVYADEAKTTEWAREIVSATEMHVKIPSLTTTTDIYVDYDGVRADYAVTDTYGRNAVWSDYSGVWHMEGNSNDSTADTHNGTDTSVTYGTSFGQIEQGGDYNGTSSRTLVPNNADFTDTDNLYLSVWFKADTSHSGQVVAKSDSITTYMYLRTLVSGTMKLKFNGDTDAGALSITGSTTLSAGTWYKATVTYSKSSGKLRLYLNDSQDATEVSTTNSLTPGTGSVGFGRLGDFAAQYFNGNIDEVRWSKIQLSSNWITTETNNQSDEASFWGTWTDAGGGGGANTTNFFMMT